MTASVRRSLLGLTLASSLLAGSASLTAAQSCDWAAYPDVCIPLAWEVGDLECADIPYANFRVFPPDPHFFDEDYDGYGCEWG